ncbi:MAG: amidase family protein [Pseudomonadota bacterium]
MTAADPNTDTVPPTGPLWALPATAIASLIRSRSLSAREATESALARLDAVNPAINAVIDALPEEARAAADAVDAALARGEDPGPLAGVPVTVKVNVDLTGRATTNGLTLQRDLVAREDNPVVANLRRAGAVILGRTNTPAFSIRWFCRNRLHGATRNPHHAGLTPGGSSGGAGAAVAAGIGAIAHGTDIAGSVRYPAYACGVHGLRPGLGRIPAANFTGPDRSMGAQLTAVSGPLARRIDDLRLGLRAMAAADPRDPWWMPVPLEPADPAPRRVAFCAAPEGMPVAPEVAAALSAAAQTLADAGWEVAEATPPSFRRAAEINMALWMTEFRQTLHAKVEAEGDADAAFVAERLLAHAPQDLSGWDALQARATLVREWQVFLDEWPLLLCPASGEPPFADHSDLESETDFARIYEAQLIQVGLPALGLPGLTVATGRPGAPMGVQLIARRYREDMLFEAGAAIEAQHPPIAPVDPFAAG